MADSRNPKDWKDPTSQTSRPHTDSPNPAEVQTGAVDTQRIRGYRNLSTEEVKTINIVKDKAEEVRKLLESVGNIGGVDARWVAIARTHLQEGFMALNRAVAKPETF